MKNLVIAALLFAVAVPLFAQDPETEFSVVEATIPEMQEALREGRVTSRELVTQSLIRIALYEDTLNAVMTVNPRALEEADRLDRERAAGTVRGPLHGIPVALKDNIHTTDIRTTGGALASAALVAPYDATLTKNLRDAGAIIIAKTGMTELANWVTRGMPTNYNAMHGYGFNPYDPRRDPRDTGDGRPALATGGSSSGIGTAVSFWAANVGTETSGSILSPASANMLAAIKPTVGRVSRYGVIPITADQDTPGPMARTVTDAAIVLGVLEGDEPDPNDPATTRCEPVADYTVFLEKDGLEGARIGIPRAFFWDEYTPPGDDEPRGGLNDHQRKVMEDAIAVMKAQGAIIVDPANPPSVVAADPEENYLNWGICGSMDQLKERDCSIVFAYGMERDFNAWLASLGDAAPVETLAELRAWNQRHEKMGTLKYGQTLLDFSSAMDQEIFRERYEHDRARDIELAGTKGIDAVMEEYDLDALVFPSNWGAGIAARPGYPTVIVPFGTVPNAPSTPFPEGFDARPGPFGVSFTGTACSEPALLRLAYAFEQATQKRVPPPAFP